MSTAHKDDSFRDLTGQACPVNKRRDHGQRKVRLVPWDPAARRHSIPWEEAVSVVEHLNGVIEPGQRIVLDVQPFRRTYTDPQKNVGQTGHGEVPVVSRLPGQGPANFGFDAEHFGSAPDLEDLLAVYG